MGKFHRELISNYEKKIEAVKRVNLHEQQRVKNSSNVDYNRFS